MRLSAKLGAIRTREGVDGVPLELVAAAGL